MKARIEKTVVQIAFNAPEKEAIEQESMLPKWAVVEAAGTDDERIVREFQYWGEASRFRNGCGPGYDLMKRGENGQLTTEF